MCRIKIHWDHHLKKHLNMGIMSNGIFHGYITNNWIQILWSFRLLNPYVGDVDCADILEPGGLLAMGSIKIQHSYGKEIYEPTTYIYILCNYVITCIYICMHIYIIVIIIDNSNKNNNNNNNNSNGDNN